MELIVTGFAGDSGSRSLYKNAENEKKLLDIYPKSFFGVWKENLYSEDYTEIEGIPGVKDFESCEEGGVYGAMWRLLKRNSLGASFSLKKIPVRQQTVEVCEMLSLDPMRLSSEGVYIAVCEDAAELKKRFTGAVTIGYTEKGPAIKRIDGGSISYLRKQ